MMLVDGIIRQLCELPEIWADCRSPDPGPLVTPFDPALLGPASLDMRLGTVFDSPAALAAWESVQGARGAPLRPSNDPETGNWYVQPTPGGGPQGVEVRIEPGQVVACVSLEYFRLPANVAGHVHMKSSWARRWLNHSTAALIHPGFHGQITFELRNDGSRPISIFSGGSVTQIAFVRCAADAEVPYYARAGAKYQGQRNQVRAL